MDAKIVRTTFSRFRLTYHGDTADVDREGSPKIALTASARNSAEAIGIHTIKDFWPVGERRPVEIDLTPTTATGWVANLPIRLLGDFLRLQESAEGTLAIASAAASGNAARLVVLPTSALVLKPLDDLIVFYGEAMRNGALNVAALQRPHRLAYDLWLARLRQLARDDPAFRAAYAAGAYDDADAWVEFFVNLYSPGQALAEDRDNWD